MSCLKDFVGIEELLGKTLNIYDLYILKEILITEQLHYLTNLLGSNDLDLMKRLRKAGTDHRKFMRMITVYVDITAPLYWWKEFDTSPLGAKSKKICL